MDTARNQIRILLEALIPIANNQHNHGDVSYCRLAEDSLTKAFGVGWRNIDLTTFGTSEPSVRPQEFAGIRS